jgi:hypothetical protein
MARELGESQPFKKRETLYSFWKNGFHFWEDKMDLICRQPEINATGPSVNIQ